MKLTEEEVQYLIGWVQFDLRVERHVEKKSERAIAFKQHVLDRLQHEQDIIKHRSQGAQDGWAIRRGKKAANE